MYEVEITPEGLRHPNRLPDEVRHAALPTIFGPIAENPNGWAHHWWANWKASGRHAAVTTESSTRSSKAKRPF